MSDQATLPSDNDLVAKYIMLRNHIAAEQKAFDEGMKKYHVAMETIGNVLLAVLNGRGAESTKTESGTAYLSTTWRCSVKDPEAFRQHVRETMNLSMFTNAVSKEAVEEYMEANNGHLPPGVERTGFTKVNVRKS